MYQRYWDEVASGNHLPLGMTAEEYTKYLSGLGKVDDAIALNRVDYDEIIKLRKGNEGASDVFNFTNKTNQHMNNPNRKAPVQTLKDVIEVGEAMPDPRGSSATMYYSTMYKNGKPYNIEVLYKVSTNTIYHFEYTRKVIGNLPAILK